jgi:hypothetical protein
VSPGARDRPLGRRRHALGVHALRVGGEDVVRDPAGGGDERVVGEGRHVVGHGPILTRGAG